ncbi:MAG: hypothetical protein N4A57_07945 [Anaeromicrobium sp.]|nr:hypothetical protein [Anaeromicrobium sp.]
MISSISSNKTIMVGIAGMLTSVVIYAVILHVQIIFSNSINFIST